MRLTSRIGLLAVAATLAVTWTGLANTPPDTDIDDLRDQIAELRVEVSRLRAMTGEDWLTEQRAKEIRNLVQDVLADADGRASLLQDGLTAGYDGGFFIGSSDGNFLLRMGGQIQTRFVYNSSDDDSRSGFETRRAKLKFKGHVVDPTWKYVLSLGADHDDGGFQGDLNLEDAIIKKEFENGLELWAGQYKLPFLQEELTSSSRQQAVERSLVNEEFNQDRTKGVMLAYAGDQFRVWAAFSDGFGARNRAALFIPVDQGTLRSSYAGTGRVEWLALGDWKQFKDFTSPRGSDIGLMVGGAIHYERDKYNTFVLDPDGFKTEFITWTIDGSLQGNGWNVFSYVVGKHLSSDDPTESDMDQLGFVVQGGYYFTDQWEGFARYEWGDVDTPGADDLSLLTVGANYYIHDHGLKWTTDIGIAFNPVAAAFASPLGTGWRVDDPGEDGQFVIRSQFQLQF